jgi:hypothetical protein
MKVSKMYLETTMHAITDTMPMLTSRIVATMAGVGGGGGGGRWWEDELDHNGDQRLTMLRKQFETHMQSSEERIFS